MAAFLDSLLAVKVPGTVIIKERRLGVINRSCQALILFYVIYSLWANELWVHSETPAGIVNAWPDGGNWRLDADQADYSNLPYCSGNSAFSYSYSQSFNMDNPICERLHPYEVTVKAYKTRVEFTSAFTEQREVGWLKDGASETANQALCANRGGTVSTFGMQRVCTSTRTVYPVGIDRMLMSFEHAFVPPHAESKFQHLRGSSNAPANGEGAVDSRLIASNGTHVGTSTSGSSISMPINEWLKLAGVPSLDDPNPNLTPDYRDAAKYPPFRSCGVNVEVLIEFDNRKNGQPEADSRDVFATVSVSANTDVWSGNGPEVHYEEYPRMDAGSGAQSYDKLMKYRQGVIFTFRTSGLLYRLDWQLVFNALISGLVLLAVARTVTIMYAQTLHPNASMVVNATTSKFDIDRRFAEIGLKSAIAARQFGALDKDRDQLLEAADLCSVFGHIEGTTFEQAYAIAHLIMDASTQETAQMAKARAKLQKVRAASKLALPRISFSVGDHSMQTKPGLFGPREVEDDEKDGKLDFGKFLLACEGGKMIPWSKYLLVVEREAADLVAKAPAEQRAECKEAFDAAQRSSGHRKSRLEA